MERKSFDLENFEEQIKGYKYVYVFIATEFTNSVALGVHIEAFNDISEMEEMDEDEKERLLEMNEGTTDFSDCYWTIVCVRNAETH